MSHTVLVSNIYAQRTGSNFRLYFQGCQETHDPWLPKPNITAFRSTDYGYTRMTVHNSTHLELEQVSDDKGGQIIDHIWIKKTNGHKFPSKE